jgi:DNA-nicking Smr family endonuclease
MKDYIPNIKPLVVRNTTIKCERVKQRSVQKIQFPDVPVQPHQKLGELLRKFAAKNEPVTSINRKKSRKFMAEKILDLHGATREKALESLYIFFEQCLGENIKNVLVITGGSSVRKSAIRSLFQQWIQDYFPQYVSAYGQAGAAHGGEGAFYVILKSKTKKNTDSNETRSFRKIK